MIAIIIKYLFITLPSSYMKMIYFYFVNKTLEYSPETNKKTFILLNYFTNFV